MLTRDFTKFVPTVTAPQLARYIMDKIEATPTLGSQCANILGDIVT